MVSPKMVVPAEFELLEMLRLRVPLLMPVRLRVPPLTPEKVTVPPAVVINVPLESVRILVLKSVPVETVATPPTQFCAELSSPAGRGETVFKRLTDCPSSCRELTLWSNVAADVDAVRIPRPATPEVEICGDRVHAPAASVSA